MNSLVQRQSYLIIKQPEVWNRVQIYKTH
jgi:hypothetical protein